MSPISVRIVVVLPAPLGPTKPKTSPRFTSNDRFSTARTRFMRKPVRYSLVKDSTERTTSLTSPLAPAVPVDRAQQPLFQIDARLVAQELLRLLDGGNADLHVGVRPLHHLEARSRRRQPHDL